MIALDGSTRRRRCDADHDDDYGDNCADDDDDHDRLLPLLLRVNLRYRKQSAQETVSQLPTPL